MKPILLPLILALASSAAPPESDVLFDAMNDELNRSVSQLKIENHDRPYFVSYRVDDCDSLYVSASFGALTGDSNTRYRYLTVDVHVGNYTLDSGNMHSRYEWDFEGATGNQLSLDNDYDALRHKLWLQTDSAYKKAVRNFEKKKAVLQQRSIKERPDDWSHEQPVVLIQPRLAPDYDRDGWKKSIKNLSALFKNYPMIRHSSVSLSQTTDNKYVVNNEGCKSRVVEKDCTVTIAATAQAKDGMKISDSIIVEATDAEHMPTGPQLVEKVKNLAQRLTAAVDAKEAELYQGPVLMEGEAAAEFLSRTLAPNVVVKRPSDADRSTRTEDAVLGRIGWRILPKFINVEDDPTMKDASGLKIPSSYDVDDQGVAAKKVLLVDKGILKTLLSSRLPTLKLKNSNGHALGSSNLAQVSNLVIQSDDKLDPAAANLDAQKLRAKLIDYGKEDGLDYVLIVRKLSDSQGEQSDWYDLEGSGGEGHKDQVELPMAVDISRLYLADGHEEQLRGAEFATSTVRILRGIAATGNDSKMYQRPEGILNNDSSDSYPPSYRPASITTPSLLLRDVEMQKTHADVDKPPALSHPFFDKSQSK